MGPDGNSTPTDVMTYNISTGISFGYGDYDGRVRPVSKYPGDIYLEIFPLRQPDLGIYQFVITFSDQSDDLCAGYGTLDGKIAHIKTM